ncbi:MAG: VWA domain-containing protein [Alphaproteobacteria bacterium]|nr:VWA domain-containing protein [Alphaproteobacteria bacterium]MCB9688156.1 VWA domain-containing protein [Alphaproteobacteria bacterium]
MSSDDPDRVEQALAALADSVDPFVIGVRHHSSACAAVIDALLDAFQPDALLIELPVEFEPWMRWLGHADAHAPLAVGAVCGGQIAFYPFADFSPELGAIRWATARGVRCEPFDLPVARRAEEHVRVEIDPDTPSGRVQELLNRREETEDGESLWDQLVEAPAVGADPQSVRRAALLYGWALRADTGNQVRGSDLAREAFMRERIAAAREAGAKRIACVVGSFHGAALLDDATTDPLPRVALGKPSKGPEVVTSLLPYGFEQLDSRSGYPAGIRDPRWHQRLFETLRTSEGQVTQRVEGLAGAVLVEVCRRIRDERHVAGTPDAAEALRLARGLAALRELPAPGRREVLEALQTAIGQGELMGRGRVVARAVERVLVGRERGRLAPGTPRSGLLPHVEALLAALRLPGPEDEPGRDPLRLDPLRSETDRRRHVALHRLSAAGVIYAEPADTQDDTLTSVWWCRWTAATEATLTAASLRGVTLEQAATGALRAKIAELEADEKLSAGMHVDILQAAADCGLHDEVRAGLARLRTVVASEAGLSDLVRALALGERLGHGHVPGCPMGGEDGPRVVRDEPGAVPDLELPDGLLGQVRDELLAASVRAVDGLQGSTDLGDVRALVALARVFEQAPERLGDGRLLDALLRLAEDGSPQMQGGAGGARALLGAMTWGTLGERLGSWVDACADAGSRTMLAQRLQGALTAVHAQLEGHPALLRPLLVRVAALDDEGFLTRLPALRHGFEPLSPADRDRLFEVVSEHLADREGGGAELEHDPEVLAAWASADREAAASLERLGLALPARAQEPPVAPEPEEVDALIRQHPTTTLRGPDRWRLVLGRQRQKLPPQAGRYARALDELYGQGQGEGSRGGVGGRRGGSEEPYPTVRDWSEDLSELFGGQVREEVLGRAAERGDPNALLELDPQTVTPSVQLLEQVLSLKGGLSESQLEGLRRLCDRVIAALVEALAVRVRPALTGLTLQRPTRRPSGRLDLQRTVRANLRHARLREDGSAELVPEHFVWRTRGRRSMDWRIVLVVDTSGSMDANVVHSAMMAAILSGLPAVDVRFLAFSTQVVDLSERATDPLGLLMEVRVGGGTDIGKAVRYARGLITNPTRTIVCVVSDFEEGAPVGRLVSEVRTLAESGVKLLGLAALDDHARPNYNVAISEQLVAAGMPVAALTPLELARWVGEQIK